MRVIFALSRKDDLKSQVEAFEDEKNAELERRQEERGWVRQGDSKGEPGRCMTPIGSYVERYIDIRSNGSGSKETITSARRLLQYVEAVKGTVPICKVTAEDIEGCILKVPELSEKRALERRAA